MITWNETTEFPKLPPFRSAFYLTSTNTGPVTYQIRQCRKRRHEYKIYVRAGLRPAQTPGVRRSNLSPFIRVCVSRVFDRAAAIQWCELDYATRDGVEATPVVLSARARKAFGL